jgi:hypothetical protein
MIRCDRNTCRGMNNSFTMKSTSMAANITTLGAKSRGSFVVILKNLCGPTHIQNLFAIN